MLKPLHANVVIEPAIEEKKTTSGILLTGVTNQSNMAQGKVIATGPGQPFSDKEGRAKMSVKPGDSVIYQSYDGANKINFEGKNLIIISEYEILAIVEEG